MVPPDERVRAVAKVLEPGVVYCPNMTGPSVTLVERARRVVELGATGVMVNAFAQGVDAVLALRQAEIGVPILAHRVGSGPFTRNDRFGATGAVLARLVPPVRGRLLDRGGVRRGAVRNRRRGAGQPGRPCAGHVRTAPPAMAAFGGGLGSEGVAAQATTGGRPGLLMLLGSRAYRHPGGIEGGVRAAVEARGALVGVSGGRRSPNPSRRPSSGATAGS